MPVVKTIVDDFDIDNVYFSVKAGRWYMPGRRGAVAQEVIFDVVEGQIAFVHDTAIDMLAAVLDGEIPLEVWQDAFSTELKNAHVQAMALGRGGWDYVTPSDWGKVGRKLRDEYQYLRDFAQEIADGKLTRGQIEVRAAMYGDGVWSSYWKGADARMADADNDEERRVLEPGADHCEDCEGYANEGWQAIGYFPAPGEKSKCLHRCRCHKEYRNSKTGKVTLG